MMLDLKNRTRGTYIRHPSLSHSQHEEDRGEPSRPSGRDFSCEFGTTPHLSMSHFREAEIRYRSDSDGHDLRIPYYYSECEYHYHFILRMRHRKDYGFEFESASCVLPFNTLPRPCYTNMPMLSGRLSANGSAHTT